MIEGNGHESLRLNIGSGDKLTLKGYVNIDAKFGHSAYPLAYPDNSVDEVRASHILEHFEFREIVNVLKDWARALKPGGWLKIAVPDFDFVVNNYRNGNPDGLPIFSYLMGGQMNSDDFHKSVFNYDALANALVDVGLADVQRWQSEVKDCAALPVSLNLMGQKPSRIVPSNSSSEKHNGTRPPQAVSPADPYSLESELPNSPYKAFANSIGKTNYYSQFSEDAAIEAIFKRIGVANKWCVECGAADGLFFSNTRRLIESGWQAVLVEADDKQFQRLLKLHDPDGAGVRTKLLKAPGTRYTTPQFVLWNCEASNEGETSLDAILKASYAPKDIDLLVLDVDGQEYHILNALTEYKPRVIIVEYNPDAHPMYIPEPGAARLDQAGLKAIRYVVQARGYEAICRTPVNLICVRRDLAHLLADDAPPIVAQSNNPQFVAGEYRNEAELTKERIRVRPAVVMSTPRYGPLDAAEAISDIAAHIFAPRFKSGGAFWEQGLTRSIEQALEYRDKDGEPMDVFISMDYDTFATPDDAKRLLQLLYQNPQYDCIVSMQARRGVFAEILSTTAGPVDMTQGLVPIVTGHFGLTAFRRRVFEGLRKPWLLGKPSEKGDWNDGRVDADIHFWQNFNDCGFKAALAPGVIIGHGEDAVVYPRLVNGRIEKVYISVYEWLGERSVPENAGVIA